MHINIYKHIQISYMLHERHFAVLSEIVLLSFYHNAVKPKWGPERSHKVTGVPSGNKHERGNLGPGAFISKIHRNLEKDQNGK